MKKEDSKAAQAREAVKQKAKYGATLISAENFIHTPTDHTGIRESDERRRTALRTLQAVVADGKKLERRRSITPETKKAVDTLEDLLHNSTRLQGKIVPRTPTSSPNPTAERDEPKSICHSARISHVSDHPNPAHTPTTRAAPKLLTLQNPDTMEETKPSHRIRISALTPPKTNQPVPSTNAPSQRDR